MNTINYSEKTGSMEKDEQRIIQQEQINRFGERLRMTIGDGSYRAFAERCGMSEKVIRNYVKGATYPSLDRIAQLAAAGGVEIEWLALGMHADKNTLNENINALSCSVPLSQASAGDAEIMGFVQELNEEERNLFRRVLRRWGIATLLQLTDDNNVELINLPNEIKEIAMMLKTLPAARLREIFDNLAGDECAAPLIEKSVNKAG